MSKKTNKPEEIDKLRDSLNKRNIELSEETKAIIAQNRERLSKTKRSTK